MVEADPVTVGCIPARIDIMAMVYHHRHPYRRRHRRAPGSSLHREIGMMSHMILVCAVIIVGDIQRRDLDVLHRRHHARGQAMTVIEMITTIIMMTTMTAHGESRGLGQDQGTDRVMVTRMIIASRELPQGGKKTSMKNPNLRLHPVAAIVAAVRRSQ